MPENTPVAPRGRWRRRVATTGVAVLAESLFAGASIAHAAESTPGALGLRNVGR